MSENRSAHSGWLNPGDRIGNYEVRQRLAVGREAVIYRCHDPLLDRDVAVKQIPAALEGDARRRLLKKVQVLAGLGSRQPAFITIHELIEDDRGLFIVMEVFPGRSLESMLQEGQGPSDPKAALQILWRVAAALHAVHQSGVVHRELRPASILVGEGLHVKVTDFSAGDATAVEASAYSPPELLEGLALDGRADQYSLGMIAYEMFLGRARFNEVFAEVIADGPAGWRRWHLDRAVRIPRLHEVLPHLPVALSAMVERMLSCYPQDRFGDMEELGRAIRVAFSPKRAPAAPGALPTPAELSDAAETLAISPRFAGEAHEPAPAPSLEPAGMAARTKVGLAVGVVAVVLVVGLAVLAVVSVRHHRRLIRAQEVYAAGMEFYRQGQFGTAASQFEQVVTAYPGTPSAAKAAVLLDLSTASEAIAQNHWDIAQDRLAQAGVRLADASVPASGAQEWAAMSQEHGILSARLERDRWFTTTMEKGLQALNRDDLVAARAELAALEAADLTARQREELDRLGRSINAAAFRDDFRAVLGEADQRMSLGDFGGAEASLLMAGSMLESSRAQALTAVEIGPPREQLAGAQEQLSGRRQAQQALSRLDQAVQAGDTRAELAILQEAQQAQADPQRAARIRQLQAQLALESAREHIARGDLEQAQAALRSVLAAGPAPATAPSVGPGIRPGPTTVPAEAATQTAATTQPETLDQVRAELAHVEALIRRRDLIGAAEAKMAAGRPAEALADLEAARVLLDDQQIQDRIRAARFRMDVQRGNELAEAGEYDQAIEAYQLARQASPEGSREVDARITEMSRRREYQALTTQGRAALEAQEWNEAVRLLNQAKSLEDSPEVNQLLADGKYGQNVSLGRRAMSRHDYNAARGYFNLAKRIKDTSEVNQLLEEVAKAAVAGE